MNLETLSAIKQGWTNVIFPSKEIEELANVRAKICSSCPFADTNYKFKKFIPDEKRIEEIKGLACSKCGCPLSAKLRQVIQSCPEKKW